MICVEAHVCIVLLRHCEFRCTEESNWQEVHLTFWHRNFSLKF
jgi:hypothetical protein